MRALRRIKQWFLDRYDWHLCWESRSLTISETHHGRIGFLIISMWGLDYYEFNYRPSKYGNDT